MKKMKRMILKALLLLLCAVWSVGASAQEGVQYLALNIGGEAVFISLADNPVITYSGNALHIATEAGDSYDVEVEDINPPRSASSPPTSHRCMRACCSSTI